MWLVDNANAFFSWLAGVSLTSTLSLQKADVLVHWLLLYPYLGKKQMCFAIFITSIHVYMLAFLLFCLFVFDWLWNHVFNFLLAAVSLMPSVFPYSSAVWPQALLGACVECIFSSVSLPVSAGTRRSAAVLCFCVGCTTNSWSTWSFRWLLSLLLTEELSLFCRDCKNEIYGCDISLPNLYREYVNLFKITVVPL